MVSEARRRRLAALEKKAAPAAKPDPRRELIERTVAKVLAWRGPGSWRDGPPELFATLTPEEQAEYRIILEVEKTF